VKVGTVKAVFYVKA